MTKFTTIALSCCLSVGLCYAQTTHTARTSASKAGCTNVVADLSIDVHGDSPLQQVSLPPKGKCSVSASSGGFLLPDPNCTPGAVNPSLTLDVLKSPEFTTKCVRDQATTAQQKGTTYHWYKIAKPANNTGQNQYCELDHLISLEIGGADTLDNIWPQCGPSRVALEERFFKRKDAVENYLAKQVRDGNMNLADAQKGIATDWTQYLDTAEKACPNGKCK